MVKYLASAAVVALLAGAPAIAQDQPDQRQARSGPSFGGGRQGAFDQGSSERQGSLSNQTQGSFETPRGEANFDMSGRAQPGQFEQTMPTRRAERGDWRGAHGYWMGQYTPHEHASPFQHDHGPGRASGMPSSGWPSTTPGGRVTGRPNIDVRALQKNVTSQQRFHAGTYNPPPGWYPHRWHYGEYLPRAFFISEYWISDFWAFGLFPPPPGLVWVRVGDDALLIDEYTGEIVEVVYDVFW